MSKELLQSERETLLSTAHVATRLSVSRWTVLRLAERRELAAIRIGAQLRFEPADVDELIARNRS